MPRTTRLLRALPGAALALVLLAGSLTACAGPDPGLAVGVGATSPPPPTEVTVGILPIIDVAPIYLGIKQGYFARRGLDIKPVIAQTGAEIVQKVLAGEVQIGFSNVVSLLVARENGSDVVAIGAGSSSSGDPKQDVHAVVVGKGSTLRSAKSLEGRRVAVNGLGNIGDTTVRAAVEKAGGDPSKVTFVAMPFAEMAAALQAGTVDAAWVTEPFVSGIVGGGGRVLFNNLTETYPKVQIAAYFTTGATLDKNKAVMESFVGALNDSLGYARDHQIQVREILPTYTNITRDVAVGVNLPDWPVGLDRRSLTVLGTDARRYRTLKQAPDITGLLGGP